MLRGQNPRDDLNALADATAQSPDIFSLNGKLVWLKNGQLLTVNATILAEIIATRVVTVRLTNRGSAEKPNWVREYHTFTPPSEKALHLLLRAENKDDGSLLARVPLARIS
jgi:hypothetical protein